MCLDFTSKRKLFETGGTVWAVASKKCKKSAPAEDPYKFTDTEESPEQLALLPAERSKSAE